MCWLCEQKKYYTTKQKLLDSELTYCIIGLIIRYLIISIRYGFTSESQIKNRYLPIIPNVGREYVLSGWRSVDINTVDDEINLSLIRKNIDVDMFYLNLISQTNREWVERLVMDDYYDIYHISDANKNYFEKNRKPSKEINFVKPLVDKKLFAKLTPLLSKIKREISFKNNRNNYSIENHVNLKDTNNFYKTSFLSDKSLISNDKINLIRTNEAYRKSIKILASKLSSISSKQTMKCKPIKLSPYLQNENLDLIIFKYPGRIFARELINLSKTKESKLFNYFILTVLVIHLFVPSIHRWILGRSPFGDDTWECISIIINMIILLIAFSLNILFIEVGVEDYSRKVNCMKCLSALISPDKSNCTEKLKILPVINIFKSDNLKSWLNLRLVLMNVGLRYTKRVESYAGITILFFGINTILLLLGNFNVIKAFNFDTYPVYFLMGYIQVFIFSIVLFRMIVLGVKLNEFFTKHVCEFVYIKSSFKHILQNWDIFISMETYVDPYLSITKDYYYLCLKYHKKYTLDEVEENKLSGIIMPKTDEDFKDLITLLIENIDNINERIELEIEIQPVKILGIKLTNEFLRDCYIGVFTFFYSIGQYIVSTYLMK